MVLRGCRWVIDSIDRLVDWLIGRLVDWCIDWLVDWGEAYVCCCIVCLVYKYLLTYLPNLFVACI